MPTGVVLARKHNVTRIARSIDYIGTLDTTISGSRNGFTPLVLWYRIKELGVQGIRARAKHSLELAAYAEAKLKDAGVQAWRNPDAITVVFPAVAEPLRRKWQLATQGEMSHLIVMPGIGKEQIDAFVEDVRAAHHRSLA